MNQKPLPYPPQMRNGGLPPAHLSLSSDATIDSSGWLKIKWSQPPLIVIWDVPPANLDHGDWLARAECEDHQTAAGVLPSPPLRLGGDVTTDCFIADIRYQEWKELVDFLWEDARWRSRWEEEDARRHSCWEEEDARLRSRWEENFHHLDALIAEEQRQHAAAQTIFLWLRCRRLHVRLARHTSRRHHEITERLRHAEEALGVQCHEEEASVRATALAEAAVKPEPPALLSPSPHPTLSYLGAVLNTNGGGAFVVNFDVTYGGGSNIAFRCQRQTTSGPPSRLTSLLHWALQLSPCAQSFRQGYSLPPILDTGGASYATSDEVGKSDLSLSLGGVVHYALLNDTSYSLPIPIQLCWVHSLFGGRECPSIPNVWTYTSTAEAHTTQAPSSSRLPSPWPLGSQSTRASSSRAAKSTPRSQPIYW
jgi:hypothetical protein